MTYVQYVTKYVQYIYIFWIRTPLTIKSHACNFKGIMVTIWFKSIREKKRDDRPVRFQINPNDYREKKLVHGNNRFSPLSFVGGWWWCCCCWWCGGGGGGMYKKNNIHNKLVFVDLFTLFRKHRMDSFYSTAPKYVTK